MRAANAAPATGNSCSIHNSGWKEPTNPYYPTNATVDWPASSPIGSMGHPRDKCHAVRDGDPGNCRNNPFGDEKTMIFCATDLHADMVKRLLDEAFKAMYNGDYNQAAVAKITGQSDKVEQLIRQYKNERYPNIAITVDLLTTGIDVPKICNLVFMRRVRSRILYEQMKGRATRRCDDIGNSYDIAGGRWFFDGRVLDRPLLLEGEYRLQRETAHA